MKNAARILQCILHFKTANFVSYFIYSNVTELIYIFYWFYKQKGFPAPQTNVNTAPHITTLCDTSFSNKLPFCAMSVVFFWMKKTDRDLK